MLDEDAIVALARAARLPLTPQRAAVIAPTLNVWLSDAAELNRKMSAASYLAVLPITIIAQRRP